MVELRDDFVARLVGEEIERFERRAVVLNEAVAVRHVAPFGEDRVAKGAIVGIKVAETGEGHGVKLEVRRKKLERRSKDRNRQIKLNLLAASRALCAPGQ